MLKQIGVLATLALAIALPALAQSGRADGSGGAQP